MLPASSLLRRMASSRAAFDLKHPGSRNNGFLVSLGAVYGRAASRALIVTGLQASCLSAAMCTVMAGRVPQPSKSCRLRTIWCEFSNIQFVV